MPAMSSKTRWYSAREMPISAAISSSLASRPVRRLIARMASAAALARRTTRTGAHVWRRASSIMAFMMARRSAGSPSCAAPAWRMIRNAAISPAWIRSSVCTDSGKRPLRWVASRLTIGTVRRIASASSSSGQARRYPSVAKGAGAAAADAVGGQAGVCAALALGMFFRRPSQQLDDLDLLVGGDLLIGDDPDPRAHAAQQPGDRFAQFRPRHQPGNGGDRLEAGRRVGRRRAQFRGQSRLDPERAARRRQTQYLLQQLLKLGFKSHNLQFADGAEDVLNNEPAEPHPNPFQQQPRILGDRRTFQQCGKNRPQIPDR